MDDYFGLSVVAAGSVAGAGVVPDVEPGAVEPGVVEPGAVESGVVGVGGASLSGTGVGRVIGTVLTSG